MQGDGGFIISVTFKAAIWDEPCTYNYYILENRSHYPEDYENEESGTNKEE